MTVAEAIKMPNEHVFVPGGENSRSFRNALGAFTTGVTVVTATTPEGPIGMTVNSFASVSLDPPLVLWSPAKSSSRYQAFSGATHFAIHVLSARFTRNGRAFDDLDWELNDEGVPVIPGTLARFECRQAAAHDAGDHTIIVGEVLRAAHRDGDPLCFSGGSFGRFSRQ